jgi:cysteine synthase B
MGTTGTIMGTSTLKEKKQQDYWGQRVVSQIPGIRKWPKEYLPKIFDASHCRSAKPRHVP